MSTYAIGSLVRARGREWVVLPESGPDLLMLRPLGGIEEEVTGVYLPIEPVEPATFALPDPARVGDFRSSRLLRDALRLGFRSSAGPFRSFAHLAIEPRPYQLVPLLMALKLDPVRLLIADDVGIGKTVEAALVARELLDRGEIKRLAVLCPPQLAEQWQRELADKFNIAAELVLPGTASRLERGLPPGESLFDQYPFVIVSLDFIKSDRRRDEFMRTCPEFVIVDEAHTCAWSGEGRATRHQRHNLLRGLAENAARHMILVTATPHSGNEDAFRSLLRLINPDFAALPADLTGPTNEHHRRRLAAQFVQRRRRDITQFLQTETPFPGREEAERTYKLTPNYRRLLDRVLEYAREVVTDGSGHRQRVQWWSVLALLRALASSPAAAAATLRTRAATVGTETTEEADAIGRRSVLDLTDDESSEGIDLSPGSDSEAEEDDRARHRRRLREMAALADELMGGEDSKLAGAVDLVAGLLKEGYQPIVFCRFVETAKYVAAALRASNKIPKGTEIESVTGELAPAEREQRISALGEHERRILVATDCLSEGINLQQAFDAVVHYDLSWNPTRHEQREGRVDRYGQPSPICRVVTYYGEDNGVDRIILRVLLRKHKTIRSSLGISVPVPARAEELVEAIFEDILLRKRPRNNDQLLLDFAEEDPPAVRKVTEEWQNAAEREARSRTMFAQETIKFSDVAREVEAVRSAIGSGIDVAEFVREALRYYGATVSRNGQLLEANFGDVLNRSAWPLPDNCKSIRARFSLPVREGELFLHRTHPLVEALATGILDSALDSASALDSSVKLAARCGVARTRAVERRTTLLLVRFRFHIETEWRDGRPGSQLLAEDSQVLAFAGPPENAEWLDAEAAAKLIEAEPDANLAAEQQVESVQRILTGLPALMPAIDDIARSRGRELLDAHTRVRAASRLRGVSQRVEPQLPPDILGLYVFLPHPTCRSCGMSAGTAFTTVRTEGAILPPDILSRIAAGDKDLGGLTEAAYHLTGEKFGEATNRAWNRLQSAWLNFQTARHNLQPGDSGTTVTRERLLLPLFQFLDYGRLQISKAHEIGGKTYALSHAWQNVPIHLVGCNVDLESRYRGTSPHSLLQEFLNRSEGHLWGIVSNGLRLRLLRDNISLTRQAYVEFDLEGMMAGEAYPDFVLLWLLIHQSRFEGERLELAWIEKWSLAARTEGVRVLDGLRDGVQRSIEHLGRGFIAHQANSLLWEKLRSGTLDKQDFYRQILRLVYRLLFLFVADDRDLLLAPTADPVAQKRYRDFYATTRLRRLATTRAGSRHHDLYCGLKLVMDKLASEGCPELALPALGSFLFSPRALWDLNGCEISNLYLLQAVRSLAITHTGQSRRVVDYKNLGPEELGSVYESLLELRPDLNLEAASFELNVAVGSERKTTGSYYTPTSLISCLLDSALEPVLAKAVREKEPERAILALKVVDPACGSGHFLIAAAHRIAKHLASVRTGDEEPSPEATRKALRDAIGHCVYGVDVNPMAVELCKVNLWLEALEPGRPLSFLEHHIQCGNALYGTTPRLLNGGIPEAAFSPLEGDNRDACAKWRKVNRAERAAHAARQDRFDFDAPWMKIGRITQGLMEVDRLDDDSIERIREKEQLYEKAVRSADYLDGKFLADAWCSAFVWRKDSLFNYPITEELFRQIERNPTAFHNEKRPISDEIRHLGTSYRFFHWHLCFPEVFHVVRTGEQADNVDAGWNGGFDVVLGNPPWEHVELKEIEWFSNHSPAISKASKASDRKRMIKELAQEDPALHAAFLFDLRKADGERHLARDTGRYPLCGVGRINTYAIFAELNRGLINANGRTGFIVPSGIATDDTTKLFFRDLVERGSLVNLFDFENREGIFPGVHRSYKFCLLTLAGHAERVAEARFVFFALGVEDLSDEYRQFTLSAKDFERLNPNTRTCPIFRTRRDAELTKTIYGRVPVLWREVPEDNPWKLQFKQGLFNMASDSHQFRTAAQLEKEGYRLEGNIFSSPFDRYLPLYEAKMIHQFDYRWSTYRDSEITVSLSSAEKASPSFDTQPRYWVREEVVESAIPHFPQPLHLALTLGEAATVVRILQLWHAGHAFNRGEIAEAQSRFEALSGGHADSKLLGSLASGQLETWATDLASRFSLSSEDCSRLDRLSGDYTEFANELVARFSPGWLMGWRDICRSTDERTLIATALPKAAAGDTLLLMFPQLAAKQLLPLVLANLNSFICDYIARQKIGGTHLKYHVFRQLAVLPPEFYAGSQPWQLDNESFGEWIRPRVLELTYTTYEMKPLAADCGWSGPPFEWNEMRRATLRAELDAAYLHAYGLNRDDAAYVLSLANFPIVAAKTPQVFQSILSIYDAMADASRTGVPFDSILVPPAGKRTSL